MTQGPPGAPVLATLPRADGFLFLPPAVAPLTSRELAYLQRARDAAKTLVLALTKIDAHECWHDVLEHDRRLLESIGHATALIVPVCTTPAGHDESGLETLRAAIVDAV